MLQRQRHLIGGLVIGQVPCCCRLAAWIGHLHRQVAHELGASHQGAKFGRLADHDRSTQRIVLRAGATKRRVDVGKRANRIGREHCFATGVVAGHDCAIENVVCIFSDQHRAEHGVQISVGPSTALGSGMLPCASRHAELRSAQPLQVHGHRIPTHGVATRELLAAQAPHAVVAETGGRTDFIGQRGDPTVVVHHNVARRSIGRFSRGWHPQLLRHTAFPTGKMAGVATAVGDRRNRTVGCVGHLLCQTPEGIRPYRQRIGRVELGA
ncbi:hypothetical protein D3C75_624040 [compost metagenome]